MITAVGRAAGVVALPGKIKEEYYNDGKHNSHDKDHS